MLCEKKCHKTRPCGQCPYTDRGELAPQLWDGRGYQGAVCNVDRSCSDARCCHVVDANYECVMLEAFDLKRFALGTVELWRDNCGALAVLVNELSLCAAIQQTQGKKQRLYQVSKAVACANSCRPSVATWWHGPRMAVSDTVRKLALQLCTDRGLAVVNDKLGATSLMRQVALGAALESIILLADAGEDPHAVDWQGATALHLAAQGGHTALTKRFRADNSTVDKRGETALMLAARGGHTATVLELAQECGSNVNACNMNGWTALMRAAQGLHTATVLEMALDCGADGEYC